MSTGASPQTPLDGLTANPQTRPIAGLKGPLRGRRGMEGRERLGEGKGERGNGEGRGKESWRE